jgi:glycosyltransferase involved in cell wall biosynthesis
MTLATPGAIGLLSVLAGHLAGQAVVPWEATVPRLDTEDLPPRIRPYRPASTFVYPSAARVAAVSHAVRDALAVDLHARMPLEHLVVIPNPVDGDEIRRRAQPRLARGTRLRFCSIGRLVTAKGFDVLVNAFARAELGQAWELLIVGDGPRRRELQRLVAHRGLDDHVRFLGWVENPYPVLASADVAVNASRWEGFGMVISEALALGIPQVATNCPGGVAESLGHGEFGVLARPDDAADLAVAIRRVAEDSELRRTMAERGPHRAAQYAPPLVAELVVQLAEQVRGERAGERAEEPLGASA